MRILLLTQVLPYPPDSGPKIKTLNVIRQLAQKHDLTLVSFTRGDQSESIRFLKTIAAEVHTVPIRRAKMADARALVRSLSGGKSFLIIRDDRAAMRALVECLTDENRFDLVVADQINMAQYAERVPGARKLLDAHNATWLLYRRMWQTMPPGPKKWILGRDWRLMKEYEGRICREFDGVLAVSQEDRAALEEAAGRKVKISVEPISVDTDRLRVIPRCPDANRILHIGTMYWPPNVDGVLWFFREILPLIRETYPNAGFDVVGANPPREIAALAEKTARVRVTGYVEDPTPYLEKAALTVVPLRAGGGMRVKILNALAQGTPVVSTTLGAEGIAVENGRHLLIADSPRDFAAAVTCLLRDRTLADRLAAAGRELVEQHYSLHSVGERIDALVNELCRGCLLEEA
jgi:glycosyltransferase involved in cell wall biosynthesis